jgi:hypothetical protein
MGITGVSQNSYTLDADTQLHAGLVAATGVGTVATVAQVMDFGNVTPQGVVQVAYTPAQLIIDVIAMERDTADEAYQLIYQLGDDDADFSAATTVWNRAMITLGEEVGTNTTAQAATVLGRVVLGVDNEMMGTLFRYSRIIHVIAGTIATGINYNAYLSRLT